MLTQNLIRYSLRKDRLEPRYQDPNSLLLLKLAEELIQVYEEGIGQTLEELEEITQPIVNGYRWPLLAKGLNKLLLDRSTFRMENGERIDFRSNVFTLSTLRLAQSGLGNLEHYRQVVAQELNLDPDELGRQLFADLPDRQPLEKFPTLSPKALLETYNVALVQGLLLQSEWLELRFEEPKIAPRRLLFRHLKFCRLMIRVWPQEGNGWRIRVDGPLSILQNTRKYGLQLARLFPVICTLSKWRLEARLQLKEGPITTLIVDDSQGLKAHNPNLGIYIPTEFNHFSQAFAEQKGGWTLLKEAPLVKLEQQEWCVPDFSFQHTNGTKVHLELFHHWHETTLLRRLEQLTKNSGRVPLAIGVDRGLAKKKELIQPLATSPWFAQHGFVFNDFPPVKRVVQTLDGFLRT
ncbi:MAG: DUF790 family protein [Magnetococcus sp. DMHC-6]